MSPAQEFAAISLPVEQLMPTDWYVKYPYRLVMTAPVDEMIVILSAFRRQETES